MKRKTLTTLIAALVAILTFTALPQQAQAGHNSYQRRVHHSCNHCHRPVYAYRVISYYDGCGRPVYRWATQSHNGCGARSYQSYGTSYYSGSYSRGSSCRPRRGFSFSWRR